MSSLQIQVLSDLHLDSHADNGLEFVKNLDPRGVDALVLAGDLCESDSLERCLTQICEKYADVQVLYVLGNHEFYRSSPLEVHQTMIDLESRLENLTWLRRTSTEINGIRFLGTTLWFELDPSELDPEYLMEKWRLNDFRMIEGFVGWVHREAKLERQWLKDELQKGDIVITHMLPSTSSVDARFSGSPLNRFFVSDVEDLIWRLEPKLWIHGHTHTRCDYMIKNSRIVCNPFGYRGEALSNINFDDKMMVEVKNEQ